MKCNLCDKEIISKYLKDYWGNTYHFEHKGIIPSCRYCGRFISDRLTKGGKKYKDGVHICGICLKEAITDISQIKKEHNLVLNIMAEHGFDIKKYKTEIFLLERGSKGKITREEPGYIKCEMKKINGIVKEISFRVFILKGLPREYFIETLAHEMMHQWLRLYAPNGMKPVLAEGSCNYISYLVMSRLKTSLSYYVVEGLMKDPHPHYGKGFRKVLDYSRRNGKSNLINFLKTKKRI